MNIKHIVQQYLPFLCNNFNIPDKFWSKINQKYKKRLNYFEKEINRNSIVSFETTIYELFVQVEKDDNFAIYFLKFLDNIFLELSKLIPSQLKNKFVTKIIYDFLGNFDEQKSRYLERISEILIVHKLLKAEYILLEIEYILKNGKQIDFCFQKNETKFLIEVMNIKGFKPSKIQNETDIESFLEPKIKKKLTEKISNLTPINIPNNTSLFLIPVISFDENVKSFSQYFRYFENNKLKGHLVLDFYTLSQAEDIDTKEKVFFFSTVAEHLIHIHENKPIYRF